MSTPDQPPTHSCDLLSWFSWPLDGSVDVWLSFETDHLFEVAVEVSFSHNPYESWDQVARSLLLSVKALVSPPWPVSTFFHSSFYMEETPVGKFWMGFSSDYFCRSVNSWSIWVWYRQYLRKESKGLQQIGSIRSIFFFWPGERSQRCNCPFCCCFQVERRSPLHPVAPRRAEFWRSGPQGCTFRTTGAHCRWRWQQRTSQQSGYHVAVHGR